jgi:hypothetical protein
MEAYLAMDNQQEDKAKNSDEKKDGLQSRNPLKTAYHVEKIAKVFKAHSSTADFDCGFVAGIVNTMEGLKQYNERVEEGIGYSPK